MGTAGICSLFQPLRQTGLGSAVPGFFPGRFPRRRALARAVRSSGRAAAYHSSVSKMVRMLPRTEYPSSSCAFYAEKFALQVIV